MQNTDDFYVNVYRKEKWDGTLLFYSNDEVTTSYVDCMAKLQSHVDDSSEAGTGDKYCAPYSPDHIEEGYWRYVCTMIRYADGESEVKDLVEDIPAKEERHAA